MEWLKIGGKIKGLWIAINFLSTGLNQGRIGKYMFQRKIKTFTQTFRNRKQIMISIYKGEQLPEQFDTIALMRETNRRFSKYLMIYEKFRKRKITRKAYEERVQDVVTWKSIGRTV